MGVSGFIFSLLKIEILPQLLMSFLSHYPLRCPTYTVHRVRYLMDLNNILEPPYVAGLNDDKIVDLFYMVILI